MKSPIFLGFKTGENAFHILQAIAWRVRTDYNLGLEDGKLTCTCVLHKFDSTCIHQDVVANKIGFGVKPDGNFESGGPYRFHEEAPNAILAVMHQHTKKVAVVSPRVGDISLYDLLWLLSGNAPTPGILKAQREGTTLNVKRIYAEAVASKAKALPVSDSTVLKAGREVTGSSAAAEDEFDFSSSEAPVRADAPKADTKAEAAAIPTWRKIPKPDARQFYVSDENWENLVYTLQRGKNLLLTGPSGSGKSEVCYIAAKALGIGLEPFNMGAMSEPRTSLIGNTHFSKDKGTWFAESRFVRAVKGGDGKGQTILLDELTRSERGAYNILLPLLDRQGYLALDEAEDSPRIERHEGVSFLATANIGMEYTGTEAMDKALKDRFGVIIDMFFPPESNEVGILLARCKGLDMPYAKKLVKLAGVQRNLAKNEGEFVEMISTRMLLEAGERIGDGMSFKSAVQHCICNQFSADGGDSSDRTKVLQIIQKEG